eukprot:CAMPEP_0194329574 /NCGR_PEP_ID=MMETSP0171-20130528/48732_1 /TAXON_ID=218684 /ORGANISM="Corethron pennatum, Strain L29A3" /LENGTH=328 /DNA_ID=CAMNT_0039090345 /DNA_START=117 /DNA_END=1100 /DNA_ORIENTATION=-
MAQPRRRRPRSRVVAAVLPLVVFIATSMFSGTASAARGDPQPLPAAGTRRKCAVMAAEGSAVSPGGATAAPKTMTAGRMQFFNLLAGGVSGSVASTLTAPLDVIKTQLQSSVSAAASGGPLSIGRGILRSEGISGLFRGLPPTLVGIIPSRSTYFWAYETTKRSIRPHVGDGTVNALVSGLSAGLVGNTVTNPIWMVKTRMQLMTAGGATGIAGSGNTAYTGYLDAIRTIKREEGLGGFYRGISASYWGCIEGSIQFVLYERIKRSLLVRENARRSAGDLPPTQSLPKAVYFSSAAFAKCVATVATYPHEVARTRMRERAREGVFKYS